MADELVAKQNGDVIEGHRIEKEIGRGAASIIYLAHDQRTKQVWALKHVQKLTDKDQRFLDQAEIEHKVAQSLDHDTIRRIPRLIKKGSLLRTRELFLVMELVDGMSMDRHPPATFESAVHIFHQVAQGLGHMHDRGYIHADMKPNNIVVSDSDRAKVIDLGQSCKAGTIKPRIQGTPDYIAPEQVHRRAITERTDVYNFGATMYWVMTRQNIPTALGRGDSLMGSRDDNLIERARPAAELNPRVPPILDDLIMRCIEIDAEKRPGSMKEVADRLELIHAKLKADRSTRAAPAAQVVDNDD